MAVKNQTRSVIATLACVSASLAAACSSTGSDPAAAASSTVQAGDPAAEGYARQVLARLESATDRPPRPRRAASDRLDLSLALISAGRHDEAGGTAPPAWALRRIRFSAEQAKSRFLRHVTH